MQACTKGYILTTEVNFLIISCVQKMLCNELHSVKKIAVFKITEPSGFSAASCIFRIV